MAEVIKDEQSIKNPSLFLKVQNKSKVKIQSHLMRLFTAYIPAKKMSVLWSDKLTDAKKRQEFFYWAEVKNGQEAEQGVLRLPASIFFTMNENEKILEKDKRNFEWIISKTGEGMDTKYEAVRGADVELNEKEIEENTEKLKKIITAYEGKLAEKLRDYLKDPNGL